MMLHLGRWSSLVGATRFRAWACALVVVAAGLAPSIGRAAESPAASSDQDVIAYINKYIRTGWEDNEVKPAPPAADGEWLRRLFLDVVGRIPTEEEVFKFTSDKDVKKREKIVDKLLYSEDYEQEYARNWTTIWTNLLIGRNGGNDRQRPVSRPGLMQYIRTAILNNKPYDKFVNDLVAANGNNTPGEEGYNGATNFLLDNLQEMQVPATNKTAQLFLGLRVGCTQCHNHPFNEWKQNQFWSFNAFFKQTKPLRTFQGRDVVSARLEDEDFAGESGNPEEAEIYYELRNGVLQVAYPMFVDGTKISPVGYANEVNRRDELGKLIIKSPYMRQAIVNRIWGHFFGYGFTKPVDDMGPHNPPSHPELMDRLANDFANHGFELRRLMKWYVLSEPYSLSSKMSGSNVADDPSRGETPLFSHFYIRQMSAEQLYESLMTATQVDKTGADEDQREKIKNMWLQQFVLAFGTDENDEATTFNGTIPQALMMMNGELMQKANSVERGSFLHTILNSKDNVGVKVNKLYYAALARSPSKAELDMASKLLGARGGDGAAAMQDVWWALLNSNEFIINH